MDRRDLLASAGAVALVSVSAGISRGFVGGEIAKSTSTLDKLHQECLDICQGCEAACNMTVTYCVTHMASGHKEHAACAALAMSCQDFCGLSAKLIARSCTLAPASCEACAKACEACATECEKIKSDAQLAACAKICRECAAACRKMV